MYTVKIPSRRAPKDLYKTQSDFTDYTMKSNHMLDIINLAVLK